jgi:hypothetical protein
MTVLMYRPEPLVCPPSIVFGAGRIAQWTRNGVQVRALARLESPPLALGAGGPAAFGALGDGSLLVLTPKVALQLAPDRDEPTSRPGLFMLMSDDNPRVRADPDRPRGFFLANASSLDRYELPEGPERVTAKQMLDVDPRVTATLCTLPGGAFAYLEGGEVRRCTPAQPRGVGHPVAGGPAAHLAPGPGGQVWVSLAEGAALLELPPQAGPARTLVATNAGAEVMSFDGTATHAAALALDWKPGKPGSWSVVVWKVDGAEVLRQPLPWSLPVNDPTDWFVALSPYDPFVAVGGPGRLAVWNLADGRLLAS